MQDFLFRLALMRLHHVGVDLVALGADVRQKFARFAEVVKLADPTFIGFEGAGGALFVAALPHFIEVRYARETTFEEGVSEAVNHFATVYEIVSGNQGIFRPADGSAGVVIRFFAHRKLDDALLATLLSRVLPPTISTVDVTGARLRLQWSVPSDVRREFDVGTDPRDKTQLQVALRAERPLGLPTDAFVEWIRAEAAELREQTVKTAIPLTTDVAAAV